MISIEEALNKILGHIRVLEPEEKPILECLGQVLAEDIRSDIAIPPWDNSAMDGFAVIAESTRGASPSSPRILNVIGEVAAGAVFEGEVEPGTAVRIMTGAPLPRGADSVVPFEETDEVQRKSAPNKLSQIGIRHPAEKELNVRYRGEDIEKGTPVLSRGTVLNPPEIGVLASLGRATASVIRRPVIAIMATGNEIVNSGQPLPPGKIYNSNTYSIASQISYHGAIPEILGIARDSVEDLNAKIEAGLASADMLITTGGVSLGDYDMVKDVLAARGRIDFWTVRMKPGKPLAFGVLHRKGKRKTQEVPHLGLPGNPVSAMISFEQFARPAIMKMLGKRLAAKPSITAILQDGITNSDNRRILSRVFITRHGDEYHAHLTGKQGSGILTSISKARGMAIIPEDTAEVKPGDTVRVELWDWDRDWVYGCSDEA